MNIVIIGGSHGIGKATAQNALAAGHSVTVFSPNPQTIGINHQRLSLLAGDALNEKDIQAAIKNQDAIICTLGLPTRMAIGPPFGKKSLVLSKGTENILNNTKPGQRFLCVTAIGTGDSQQQCGVFARLVLRLGLRWLFKEKDKQEVLIRGSNCNWTIIRPTALTNGQAIGAVVDNNQKIGLLTHVSRADVADVMVSSLKDPKTYRQALTIMYPPRFGDSLRWLADYRE